MSKKSKNMDETKKTLTLREQILGTDSSEEFGARKRQTHVMTRLSNDIVAILDALVELGIFKSRSEAVAAYVEKSILPHMDLYERVKIQAKQVGNLREVAVELITETFDD
ncbi:MAG: hypothetical protein ACFFAY_04555 [Promethearchaeota archaeon]